jgi:hypothetical protein
MAKDLAEYFLPQLVNGEKAKVSGLCEMHSKPVEKSYGKKTLN